MRAHIVLALFVVFWRCDCGYRSQYGGGGQYGGGAGYGGGARYGVGGDSLLLYSLRPPWKFQVPMNATLQLKF
ncbi:hypothetical protein NECAME_03282 [Necator americanus]|uniref:Secreted protein n=1 Tax=Necator americanus TaxID=51031 RepID=W2T857_NECAM|nr:hypothetical protein NECAME_03282 [Necator americanus]ETN77182.1 hypothetical protein NECAME_03282 [Necator americanus]